MKGFDVSGWVYDPASFDPFPLTGSIDDELYKKGLYVAAFNGFLDAAEKGDAVAHSSKWDICIITVRDRRKIMKKLSSSS